MNFDQWMREVDRILVARCGMDSRDLADKCYADAHESGQTPHEAVIEFFGETIEEMIDLI